MSRQIELHFLTGSVFAAGAADTARTANKPQALEVAHKLAAHISGALHTLSIAIYDFRLEEPEASVVIDAINARADAGVLVRIAYFSQPTARSSAAFTAAGSDPAPATDPAIFARMHPRVRTKAVTEADVQSIAATVQKKAIAGGGHLMHNKYVVCDEGSPAATVWTGSANFTTDAWTLQDNNILIVPSQELAGYYATDFGELWDAGRIAGTGVGDVGTALVGDVAVDVDFAPGEGATIDAAIAAHIAAASERISVASMVISSGTVLGAMIDALDRGVVLTGIYDGPQMHNVENAWTRSGSASLGPWQRVKSVLTAKASVPYSAGGAHNFMHNKCLVVDGQLVLTGSFNFSQNATRNAENVLTLHDAGLAGQYESYIAALVKKYGS